MKVRERVWLAFLIMVLAILTVASYYVLRAPRIIDFHALAASGSVDDVQRYIDVWWMPIDVKRGDQTALLAASLNGELEVMDLLLEAGANPNAKFRWAPSLPLEAAAHAPSDALFKLLEAGASLDVNADVYGMSILSRRLLGPLMGDLEDDKIVIRFLLDEGADPNDLSSDPLLLYAMRHADAEVVQMLCEAGADPNVASSWRGRYPLHLAVFYGLETAKVLVEYGADPKLTNDEGLTPLEYARESQSQQFDPETQTVVEYLESLEVVESKETGDSDG